MAAKPKPAQPARRPAPTPEQEEAALEYHEASEALRKDEVRRARAKTLCIRAGVLPDYEREPFEEGTVATVFDGRTVRIVMTVVTALERFDHEAFIEDLVRLGIDTRRLARLVKKHSSTLRPAHVFKTSLVTWPTLSIRRRSIGPVFAGRGASGGAGNLIQRSGR